MDELCKMLFKTATEMTVAQFDWSSSEAGRGLMMVAKKINTNPLGEQSHQVAPIKT
jgi:hypothetical protein